MLSLTDDLYESSVFDALPQVLHLSVVKFLPVIDLARCSRVNKLWKDMIKDNAFAIFKAHAEIPARMQLSDYSTSILKPRDKSEFVAFVQVYFPKNFANFFEVLPRTPIPLKFFYKKDGTLKTSGDTVQVIVKVAFANWDNVAKKWVQDATRPALDKRCVLTCMDSRIHRQDNQTVPFAKALEERIKRANDMGPMYPEFASSADVESCKREAANEKLAFIPLDEFPSIKYLTK